MAKKPTTNPRTTGKHMTRKAPIANRASETKQAIVLALLRRQNGASVAEIIEVTNLAGA